MDIQVLTNRLSDPSPDTAFFIAEDEKGHRLGSVHLQTGTDYYNHEKHGHIANIIVAAEGERRGIGRKLMEKQRNGPVPKVIVGSH